MKLNSKFLLLVAGLVLSVSANVDLDKARANLYKQVDFANQQFFDKAGKIREDVFDTWSDSQVKAWADAHGLKVPQPGKKDDLKAFARKHQKLLKSDVENYAKEASKTAKPFISKATDTVAAAGSDLFDSSIELWQDSTLKSFLDARGVTTPKNPTKQKLVQLAKENKNKAASYYGPWSFESWSTDDLKKWLGDQGKKAQGSRDELVKSAQDYSQKARETGGEQYNKLVDTISSTVAGFRQNSFDKWSDSDLKAFLDTYGVKTYQGTKRNELIAHVRSQYHLFTHGANPDYWTQAKDTLVNSGSQGLHHAKKHGHNLFKWGSAKAKEIYHKAAGHAQALKADL